MAIKLRQDGKMAFTTALSPDEKIVWAAAYAAYCIKHPNPSTEAAINQYGVAAANSVVLDLRAAVGALGTATMKDG